MDTFIWRPSYGASVDESPRLRIAQFGDGYTQRAEDGMNTMIKVWDLTFDGINMEGPAIRAFLKAQRGTAAFIWVDLDGDTLKYTCQKWKSTFPSFNLIAISATFVQSVDN